MQRTGGQDDTIAAIATAPGRGGVAVVRVSGPDAWRVAAAVTGRAVGAADVGRFRHVRMRQRLPSGETPVVDDGLLLVFAEPHSYTGENVVEFQGHGGSVTPRRVLEGCLAAGARLARRGEFTLRAFLNGKLDLSEAEAVIDLVDARNARAADEALARLSGGLSTRFGALYDEAIGLSARLEYALDVSEEELPADFDAATREAANTLVAHVAALRQSAREGRLLRQGALVVLAGPPNAGKSSLMNALLGENRAIVSPEAGTTRDTIEEGCEIGGWPVRLTDTAGLRETDNAVEREGVARARDLLARADLVVLLDDDPKRLCALPESSLPAVLRVHAKCDLDDPATLSALPSDTMAVSAKTGDGLDALRAAIAARLTTLAAKADGETGADATVRQVERLDAATAALAPACTTGTDPAVRANAVRTAAERIGETVGKTYTDDLLENLFSRFCVGK